MCGWSDAFANTGRSTLYIGDGKRVLFTVVFGFHADASVTLRCTEILFARKVVRCWNSLPAHPEDFSSLTAFKHLLQRTDVARFVTCRYNLGVEDEMFE